MSARRDRQRVAEMVGGELVDAGWLRRLGRISFLGTLDHHPRSRRASNRLEHSLAVAALGEGVALSLELSRREAKAFVAACLLHDVGHYPLSHAAESAFERALGANHHEVTRWIVCGEGEIDVGRSLRPLLEARDIDPQEVWATIDGRGPLSAFLRAPINLDTLDGVNRVAHDFGWRRAPIPEGLFEWVGGEPGISASGVDAVDAFWRLKDRVYDQIINLPSNILAETRLCEVVASNVTRALFGQYERFDDAMLHELMGERFGQPVLRDSEDDDYEFRDHAAWGQVLVRMRKRYYVAAASDTGAGANPLALSESPRRYRHIREPAYLVSRRRQLELPHTATSLSVEDPEI